MEPVRLSLFIVYTRPYTRLHLCGNYLGRWESFMSSSTKQLAFCSAVYLLFAGVAFGAADLKPEDLLQKHLDSIATSQTRSAARSRVIEGDAVYKVVIGGSGTADGKAVLVSEGHKFQFLLKVSAQKYHGEKLLSDGDKTFVVGTYDDHTRSEFGELLRGEDLALKEGLLGGTLSTAWPLLDLEARKSKLKYVGRKRVDGVELEALTYQPKRSSDMDVTLYFDPETSRHVMTLYSLKRAGSFGTIQYQAKEGAVINIGSDDSLSSSRQQTRYRIEERFSDFKNSDGITLPSHYQLRFAVELENGFTKSVEWDVNTTRVLSNPTLDPRNFQIP